MIGIGLIPTLVQSLLPSPFNYRNTPFPVCQPTNDDDLCIRAKADYAFHPGDVVPMLVDRCYEEWFARDEVTGYRVERTLASDHDGIQIQIAPTFNQVHSGCRMEVLKLHAVPTETPPGSYHFEGASTVYGRLKTVTVVWRSESFKVDK